MCAIVENRSSDRTGREHLNEAPMQSPRFAVSGIVLSTFILLASILLTSICRAAADAQGGAAPPWPTKEWQTSTPEEQGMDSTALAKLIAFGTGRSFDSLLIARHGKIVLDAYYAPYTADIPHAINSATKAVIGTLTAIALKDGLLDSRTIRRWSFLATAALPTSTTKRKR
jgi:beta-lactamase family protein